MRGHWLPWLLAVALCGPLRAAPAPQEAAESRAWRTRIEAYSRDQNEEVRRALRMILQDATDLARLDPHKAHDALQATMAKIESAGRQPEGAVARERLDAPIGNFGQVTEGLYRGAQPSRRGLRWLHAQGISTVVVLREAGVEETNYPGYSRADYLHDIRGLGMKCVELTIRDHTLPTPEQIRQFAGTVEQGPCFVHCSAGIGRTGIMAGLYLRSRGSSPQQALEHCRRFQLNPDLYPDHALQASFIANYPLEHGLSEPGDLVWKGGTTANPLTSALSLGQGFLVEPSARVSLEIDRPAPTLERLSRDLREGRFVCLEFRSDQEISVLASVARVFPAGQKMGAMALRELSPSSEGPLGLADLRRARALLGQVPFEVRASGLTPAMLTPQFLDELIGRLEGEAQVIDLNLGQNPSVEVVRYLGGRGLACRVRLDGPGDKAWWDSLKVAYLATAI